jgi:hypothetical protein
LTPDLVRQSLRTQAEYCLTLGSPFTAKLCLLAAERLTDRTAVGSAILDWPGNPSPSGEALALRLAGALNAIVIAGHDSKLASIYPPNAPPADDYAFWKIVEASLEEHREFVLDRLNSPPQTNEIRRSSAIYAGLMEVANRFGDPVVLSELGASAGLNLLCDQFSHRFSNKVCGNSDSKVHLSPDWRGNLPRFANPRVVERRGCDLNPLNVGSKPDMDRLRSYIWPDQSDRVKLTENAILVARSMLEPGAIEEADAAVWLEKRLHQRRLKMTHLVFHTIAWQYFPTAVRETCTMLLEQAGAQATFDTPLALLGIEAESGAGGGAGAAIRLRTWPGGDVTLIGFMDFHGRWIEWLAG